MTKKLSYKNAIKRAAKILNNRKRALSLIQEASVTLQSRAAVSAKLQAVKAQLFAFMRLSKAYITGQYRNISFKSMLYTVAVLVYFVTPVDIVPDFLPVGGYLDDASLIIWLYQYLGEEMQQFLEWESNHNQVEEI